MVAATGIDILFQVARLVVLEKDADSQVEAIVNIIADLIGALPWLHMALGVKASVTDGWMTVLTLVLGVVKPLYVALHQWGGWGKAIAANAWFAAKASATGPLGLIVRILIGLLQPVMSALVSAAASAVQALAWNQFHMIDDMREEHIATFCSEHSGVCPAYPQG
jgi:hypothetical protein